MNDPRETIWANAFNAALSAGADPSVAEDRATHAQRLYEARWPPAPPAKYVSGGMDVSAMKNAVADLKANGRWDAAAVLESLFEAMKNAAERGEAVKWMPPMRGA